MKAAEDVTRLLSAASEGDRGAMNRLVPIVYDELRAMAQRSMRSEREDHTLQPTALVHEVFLKLVDQTRVRWRDRAHFFAVASGAIRRVLVDHARGRGRAKRGGGQRPVRLDEQLAASFDEVIDVLWLDEAMEKLAEMSPQSARTVELRFFGGLTLEETANVLGVSTSTVERDWRYARAWLYRLLGGEERRPGDGGG